MSNSQAGAVMGSSDDLAVVNSKAGGRGMRFEHVFSRPGVHPFDEIEWNFRTASISDDAGNSIFKQENVEVPKSWSDLATKIAVSKYFYGDIAKGTDPTRGGRETSVKQLIHRVTRTITDWGLKDGYFASESDAEVFYGELTWLCVNQYGAFNSPVWFNLGLWHQYGIGQNSGQGNFFFNRQTGQAERAKTQYEYPQCSACFIQSVNDNMESIMELARSEAMLFKFGSGSGTDLTPIRSTREKLSGGGMPSGPLSFLKVYDQVANVVKSGGKTRRAAKMNTLKVWHPDIEEFIDAKQKEERKAWALIEEGYSADFNGEAYGSIMYQNENLSVRATDEFMGAAVEGREFWTRYIVSGQPCEKKDARELLRKIAEGTHVCGDPGMQFDDTIHRWHTCKGTDRQHSTNPCSEYLFLNDTACNLASLNLMKFKRADGSFDVRQFKAAVRTFITAQEILVDNASYPTASITVNSHIFRTLGLGYANLGALLMSYGQGYDTDEGRAMAGAITAVMTGHAYEVSAEIAAAEGPFPGYRDARAQGIPNPPKADNVESMREVICLHRDHVERIHPSCPGYLRDAARECWDAALQKGDAHGYRNAQVTVLAPTGTIGFLMDCDTTGIEPEIALVKYKNLAGGGQLTILNRTVPAALRSLGYDDAAVAKIADHLEKYGTIEDVDVDGGVARSGLRPEHLAVFDCAFRPAKGKRSLHYRGHILMMAAAQPFLSGAISKTVNLPTDVKVEDIMNTYIEGWRLGLKAIAIYRDGSKRSAPINTSKSSGAKAEVVAAPVGPVRRRMADTRQSVTHKFDIAGHEGYLTVGEFEDGTPGELFVTMAKEGSTIGGLMDTVGTLVSLSLQYGVPLEAMVKKFAYQRFEPSGFTRNPEIPMAKSIADYIFRWLGNRYVPGYREAHSPKYNQPELPMPEIHEQERKAVNKVVPELPRTGDPENASKVLARGKINEPDDGLVVRYRDGMTCPVCGSSDIRHTGACATCNNCATSLGCS